LNAFFDNEINNYDDKSLMISSQSQKYGLNGVLLKNETLSCLLSETRTINEYESTTILIDNDEDDDTSRPPKYPKLLPISNKNSIQLTQNLQKRVQNELKKLNIKYVKISKEYIPLNKSLLNNRFNLIGDSALFNSKRFRVSFTQPCKFTSLKVINDKISKYSSHTLVQIKQLQMFNLPSNSININTQTNDDSNINKLKENCELFLNIQFKYTNIHVDNNDKIPFCLSKQGNSIIKEYSNATQELRNKIG
jgi:hypothetical protein